MSMDNGDLWTKAYEAYQAGEIEREDFYAISDSIMAQEKAEDERLEELRRERDRAKPKGFVSVGINFKL